jgi:hypothetical protein
MQQLIDKVGKLERRELKGVAAILEKARAEVAARVAESQWEVQHIAQLKEAIANAVRGFERQYGAAASDYFGNMWNAGIDMVDAPLASAGIRTAAPEISRTALEILQGYSADFIEGLAADALKKVNNAVTMSIMGQQTPFEAMKAIGVSLDDKGIFPAVLRRAETIMRTEGGRINSAARHARQLAVVDAGTDPEMKWQKRWHSSGKAHPREEHESLNGVTVDFNDDFPGGRPYPHAPGLPADEVINCGCTHSLISPEWDELPRQFEPVVYAERADYGRAA